MPNLSSRLTFAIAWLVLSTTALAAPKPRIPKPPAPPPIKIAKTYGVTGREADYSAKAYRLDQAKAKRYAADFASEHNLKPEAQERIAKARVVELRTRDYPRRWSQQQKMRLYKKELIAVQRAQKKIDDYDPVANAPHPFTDPSVIAIVRDSTDCNEPAPSAVEISGWSLRNNRSKVAGC